MKNKTITAISAGTSYSMLKLTQSKVDPYTRAAIGSILGFTLALSTNNNFRYIGIGTMIAGVLQLIDVLKGGRLIKNQCTLPVYIIGEKSGLSVLEYGQVPAGNIDGFSFKGLYGVFKLSDGVYANINSHNFIKYTPGLGRIINQNLRSGGFKTKQWVDLQSDLRWKELYNKSI